MLWKIYEFYCPADSEILQMKIQVAKSLDNMNCKFTTLAAGDE